jgi:hypothetical protein
MCWTPTLCVRSSSRPPRTSGAGPSFFIDAYLAAADGDEARAAWAALSAPFPFLHDDMRTAHSVTFALKLWLVESQYPAVHAELDAMVGDRVKTWRGFFHSSFLFVHALTGEGVDPSSPLLVAVQKVFIDYEAALVPAVFKHLSAIVLGSSDC